MSRQTAVTAYIPSEQLLSFVVDGRVKCPVMTSDVTQQHLLLEKHAVTVVCLSAGTCMVFQESVAGSICS